MNGRSVAHALAGVALLLIAAVIVVAARILAN